jgi:hypothetical protein
VFDYDQATNKAYNVEQSLSGYWITQDLGTGGPVTQVSASGKDSVTVNVPVHWTDDQTGLDNFLVLWEATMPPPAAGEEYYITPIGNVNGKANFIGNPGCGDICTDDNSGRYATVTMTYDPRDNTPAESLTVAWYDSDNGWQFSDIYYPNGLAPYFDVVHHRATFGVTCFDGIYAVVKRAKVSSFAGITRTNMQPMCGNFTDPFPTLWYQFSDVFKNKVNWSALEIVVDGVTIQPNTFCFNCDGGSKQKPHTNNGAAGAAKHDSNVKTAASGTANYWEVEIDEVAARVTLEYIRPGSSDDEGDPTDPSDQNMPLACGPHTVLISAPDLQGRVQSLEDHFSVDCMAPSVVFPNYYDSKNPSITFTANDDSSGVDWNNIFADVFFIAKPDTAAGSSNNIERFRYAQTFFPGQIVNYRLNDTSNAVKITTHYELTDERAILVILYGGTRSYQPTYSSNYSSSDVYSWYGVSDGISDCVGNHSTPQEQILAIDYGAPTFVVTSAAGACPMTIRISDDGSGFPNSSVEIYENGAKTTKPAKTKAADVDSPGDWYFAASGDGGLLYYCPSSGASFEVRVTDRAGNVGSYTGESNAPISGTGLDGSFVGPNPWDPLKDGNLALNIKLDGTASVTVKIYDMFGSEVTTLASGQVMGSGAIQWNGTTSGGRRVANGVYLAHIEASKGGGSASTVLKIAVIEK